jgi:hypothetical protein
VSLRAVWIVRYVCADHYEAEWAGCQTFVSWLCVTEGDESLIPESPLLQGKQLSPMNSNSRAQKWPSSVKVPVFVIRYSLIATSFPDSFPYPDSLIPPNGDSAAEELPIKINLVHFYFGVGALTSVHTNHASFKVLQESPSSVDVLGEEIRRQSHLHCVSQITKKPGKLTLVLFAACTASSSVSKE